MNDAQRKRLTEYLGECWHDAGNDETCSKCGKTFRGYYSEGINRTFTTPADLIALIREMYTTIDWIKFSNFALDKYHEDHVHVETVEDQYDFFGWLIINPVRTCELIAEWMEKEAK